LKNTNWSEVLKEINKDPAGFYEDGGWKHVQEDQVHKRENREFFFFKIFLFIVG